MTYCLGLKTREGIIGFADRRIQDAIENIPAQVLGKSFIEESQLVK